MQKIIGSVMVGGEKVQVEEQGNYPSDLFTPVLRATCETGEPYGVVSVCIPGAGQVLKPGEYLVKTWSENQAITDALLQAGLFVDTGARIPTGYATASIWKRKV